MVDCQCGTGSGLAEPGEAKSVENSKNISQATRWFPPSRGCRAKVFGSGLGAAMNIQFLVDVHQVSSHRGRTDGKAVADLFVGKPFGQQCQNLCLAHREEAWNF